ncbi:hypothetical protein K501DRAFT_237511 [Backusella circina FSU 941]|nr:hypothetical protein K501DRAFT_237511 [Backusella circina FSU 941]
MSKIHQDMRITCQNDKRKGEVDQWINWKVRLVAIDHGKEVKGKLSTLLDHVEYVLHPTFTNPRRVATTEPYTIQEKGWGEFDMRVILFFKNDLYTPENIFFDLHFNSPSYNVLHRIEFEDAPPELSKLILTTHPSSESSHNKKRLSSPTSSASSSKKLKHKKTTNAKYPASSPTSSSTSTTSLSPVLSTSPIVNNNNVADKKPALTDDEEGVVDDIYNQEDLKSASPIHSGVLDEGVKEAWNIPETLDIFELARRLSNMTAEQTQEVEDLIRERRKADMIVEENEDEFIVDLYSLGPDLLNSLWEYTENNLSPHPPSVSSPLALLQAHGMLD